MADNNQVQLSAATMRTLMRELKQYSQSPPFDDILIDCDTDNFNIIDATINGPISTPFDNGQFKIRMHMSNDYPLSPPKCYFITKIFHPNVAPGSGEICVNTLKKDWNASYGIHHILQVIRCLLIQPNPESALNEEAGKLLLDNYDDYNKRAVMMTRIHAKILIDIKAQLNINKSGNDSSTQNGNNAAPQSSDKENTSNTSDAVSSNKPVDNKPKPAAAKKNLKRL